ncbi:MAG: HAD-IB family phosphatase [Acidobacteria bacterium]|nr:HAD-IB family phosphatase [Acidobacteriota bacterium]
MTKLHIFSDFDGTISEKDTLVFLATNLGGGQKMVQTIGRLIREGELTLSEGIAAEMRSIRRPFAEAEKLLREQVRIDPAFIPFAAWCEAKAIPLTILSAGFHQLIDLFIRQSDFPHLEILANTLKPSEEVGWQCVFRDKTDWGHDKSVAIKAAKKRGEYAIFIGDGLSDRGAAEAADQVFAKHSLVEHCRQRKINFHEYQTFDDVLKKLQQQL